MKVLLWSVVAAFAVSATLVLASDRIPRESERRALAMMSDHCADTWCEGDLGFEFRDLRCKGGECQVTFTYREHGERVRRTEDRQAGFSLSYQAPAGRGSCRIHGIRSETDLLEAPASSGYRALSSRALQSIGACLERLQDEVYGSGH